MPVDRPRAVLIAGPTASGKSALAHALAQARDGVIVNADSMQVYRELRIVTARPTAEDEAAVPHRLYGHVPASEPYSTGRWIDDITAVLDEIWSAGRLPIIVGGTGLYFTALLKGLSPIPTIPAEIRTRWRQFAAQAEPGELHAELQKRDPLMAERLSPGDTQRLTRALEVVEATGRSLAHWQEMPGTPVIDPATCQRLLIDLPRDVVHARCDARFDAMIDAGAVDEVRALLALQLPVSLPAMRALGVRPLARFIRHEMALNEAALAAKAETRQYVKRQLTWFSRNMIAWKVIKHEHLKRISDKHEILID